MSATTFTGHVRQRQCTRDHRGEPTEWGNAAPLARCVCCHDVHAEHGQRELDQPLVEPIVFGVALMFGGLTQLICGVIQFRNGSTFTGMLFGAFGAF